MTKAVGIRSIEQKDNHTLRIVWSDGDQRDYRLCDLQRRCPCVGCVDEVSGRRVAKPELVPDNLTARRVVSVGRYALRIEFSSGCSHGIYSFDYLRKLAG